MTPSMKAHTASFHALRTIINIKEINILAYFHLVKEKFGFSTRMLCYQLATF